MLYEVVNDALPVASTSVEGVFFSASSVRAPFCMPFLFIALFYRNVFEIAVRHLSPLGRSTFCILIPSPLGPNSGNVPSPCRVFFSMWVIDDEEGNFSYSADKAFIGTLLVKGGTGRR